MIQIISMLIVMVSFFLGVIVGNKLHKNEKIEIPKIDKKKIPFTDEYKQTKEEAERVKKLNTILENINNYDGTSNNQRSVK